MAEKPSKYADWVTDGDPAKVEEPSGALKGEGYIALEKPKSKNHNWLFYNFDQWTKYNAGNAEYNVIVGGPAKEQDYASLADYIADSPTAGDRILIKDDETISSKMTIPANILLSIQKGKKLTCNTNLASAVIEFSDGVVTIGDFRLELTQAGVTNAGFSLNGNNNSHQNLIVELDQAGATLTDAFKIESGKNGNVAKGIAIQTAGTITNALNDASGETENDVSIRGIV